MATLATRFGPEDPRFALPDAAGLAADSGPTTTAALRALGILQLSPALAEKADGQELPPGEHLDTPSTSLGAVWDFKGLVVVPDRTYGDVEAFNSAVDL